MAVTPNYSWPVPVATDLVKDGYAAIADLGDAIDATVFGLAVGGLVLINTTTYTAVASQSVNDVFSATYENYKIIIRQGAQASGGDHRLKLRVGGADSSASYYLGGEIANVGGTSNISENNVTTGFQINQNNISELSTTMDIIAPFLTEKTRVNGLSTSRYTTTNRGMYFGGVHDLANSYTGFTIINQGNQTGKIFVYGYNL